MRLQPLPAFADNYIWLLSDDAGHALLVDPGDAQAALAATAALPRLDGVLLTHHHNDHVGGVPALRERWPAAACVAPADPRIPDATRRVRDGEVVEVGPWRFEVIDVPGHTLGHVAFHGHGLLFCGDTLFSLGCGRLFEGTPAQMLASLDRLAALPGDTRVCCGHEYTMANAAFALQVEPDNAELQQRARSAADARRAGHPTLPSTMAQERACNPFLRVDAPAVARAIAQRLGRAPVDRVEAFAVLRAWKDDFRA